MNNRLFKDDRCAKEPHRIVIAEPAPEGPLVNIATYTQLSGNRPFQVRNAIIGGLLPVVRVGVRALVRLPRYGRF